jgi:hypothetical protein
MDPNFKLPTICTHSISWEKLRRITLASCKEAIVLARYTQELNFPNNFWRKLPTTNFTKANSAMLGLKYTNISTTDAFIYFY